MESFSARIRYITGILITFFIAVSSMALTSLPILANIGTLAVAIFIAIIIRHSFEKMYLFDKGIDFSAKKLLKLAIILYGLKLNMNIIFEEGWQLLLLGIFVIIFSIILVVVINYFLKGDSTITLLLGIGTGICGAAAIAAASSIIRSKDQDAAISVGIISIVGTIFALIYSFLFTYLSPDLSVESYAIWSGSSLHEVANVALAGHVAGDDGMALAILAKLTRVLMLIPFCLILIFIMRRKSDQQGGEKVAIPYFLFGFVLMSVINTFFNIPDGILDTIDQSTTLFLVMAMAGLGMKVSLGDIRNRAMRPLLAVIITSLALSFITFYIAVTFW